MKPLVKGDYVLATKYRDGDPFDGYAVGFYDSAYDHFGQVRHMVVNANGEPYRANGFRRAERVSHELGSWILQHRFAIESLTAQSPVNMWKFRRAAERTALERWVADEGASTVAAYQKRYDKSERD